MQTFSCECHWCGKPLIRKKQSVNVLYHFCDRVCKGEYQRTKKPVTEEWLRQKYLVEGLDTTQIAHLVGRDPKSVWNWLKDFGIPTRPRGSDKRQHFKKGDKNAFEGRKHTPETRARLSAIAKADGRVPFDPVLGPNNGRRGKDHQSWKGGITPARQAFYASPEWAKASRTAWKRDGGFCQRCERHCDDDDELSFDLHHIVGFEYVPLRAEVSNLVLLCEKCHYWVHGKQNVDRDFIKEIPK